MNLLERHLARAYRPDSLAWDDRELLAREDAWTFALSAQLAPEDADCDFYWAPLVPSAPQIALHLARLRGQLRARLLAALDRRRWVAAFVPPAWAREPRPLPLTGPEVGAWRNRGPPAAVAALGAPVIWP